MKYVDESNLQRFLDKLKGLFVKKSEVVNVQANPTLAGTESILTGL